MNGEQPNAATKSAGAGRRRYVSRLTPEQRSLQARLAAQTRWANTTDRTAATRPAREAFAARWDDAADPALARKAHMTSLALRSSIARSRRSA